jgi:hypothetical protein
MIISHKKPLYFDRFLWISGQAMLSQQKGVYRVNCIDCLDRTNVVQASNTIHLPGLYGLTSYAVGVRSVRSKSAATRLGLEPFRFYGGNGCRFQRWYDSGLSVG